MNPDLPPLRSVYESTMRKLAGVVLVLGLIASLVVFFTAPVEAEAPATVVVASVDNSKKYQLELERIGGRSAVAAAQFTSWFDSLWHGERLGATLAVLSVAASLVCFMASKLPPVDD